MKQQTEKKLQAKLEAIRILIDDCEKLINEDAGE